MKRKICSILLTLVLVLSFSLLTAVPASAATPPDLDVAETFAVLGGTGNVNLGSANITGDVGVRSLAAYIPGTSTIDGTVHAGNTTYLPANNSFYLAYDALPLEYPGCTQTLVSAPPASFTLPPGVYCTTAGLTFSTMTLTLDAGGDPYAVWIFKVGTPGGTGALTGTDFIVNVTGGGSPGNVFWWVAEEVTMTDSNLKGTILAGTSVSVERGTSIARALAKVAVTLVGPIPSFSAPPPVSVPPVPPVPPGPSGPTVGGKAYPINKVNVLIPWLIPALIIVIGGSALALRRRTSR